MEPAAKKLLKASLGSYDLQYMKVETECVVATNESILTIVFNTDGFGGRTGIFSKDGDKIDVENDYEYPNWMEAFPKEDAKETVYLRTLADLICFLGEKGRTYNVDLIKGLPSEAEMNVLLYSHVVMVYYPELETIVIIRTTDVGKSLGIGSSFKNYKGFISDVEKRQRKKFEDEEHQLELFEGHKLEE